MEFIRRFLQHVLPSGFMKVRHFGFMSATCSVNTDTIRQMILKQTRSPLLQPTCKPEAPGGPYCPDCGGVLVFVKSILPFHKTLYDTGRLIICIEENAIDHPGSVNNRQYG